MICSHENRITSQGYVVCTDCGTCLDTIYTPYTYIQDHVPLSITCGTHIGYPKDRVGKYRRLSNLNTKSDQRLYSQIFLYTKSLLSNLGLNVDIHRLFHDYMCSVHVDVKKHSPMKGTHTFVPVMTYIILTDMGMKVSKKEVLEHSGTTLKKMNKGIKQVRLDLGLRRVR